MPQGTPTETPSGPYRASAKKPNAESRARKAMMLSGAVLPGAGQIYLGQRVKGILIIVGVFFFLAVFLVKLSQGMTGYMDTLMGTAFPDPGTIANGPQSVNTSVISHEIFQGLFYGVMPMVVLWIYSAWDAHRVGKKQDGD
ncbi:MAG: hypothetical protein H6684_11755 [Deltaproteobacteria bacterium]|nr:hypothetical protein [bacterium]MCB9476471.1 hypothetical protein [Deltaproteobacteria bacterium]MCB9478892.1 hypothetical protein [Deltaproteobacteria bacterium]MCB9489398.1 hypothetical protein [Deltaproteobacteria bacterium]